MVNFILAGSCGVGKSVVGKYLANHAKLKYLDFDALGIKDMEERKGGTSPFSRTGLNFRQSIPMIMDTSIDGYVLDIGGSTVFHEKADNNERLAQVIWLKNTYLARVIVLTATKETLANRFISDESRDKFDFDAIWDEWINIAEPYWRQCGDVFVDTSFLTISDVITKIEMISTS